MLQWQTYHAADNAVWAAYASKQKQVAVVNDWAAFNTYLATLTTRGRTGNLEDLVNVIAGTTFAAANPLLYTFTQADFGNLFSQLSGWFDCLEVPSTTKYFGAPIGQTALVWYYNKAAFKKAGLPAKAPATWADLVTVCSALKNAGITPIANSGADNTTTWWMWSSFTVQFYPNPTLGPEFATGQLKVTDPGMANSIAYMAKMYEMGWWTSAALSNKFTDALSDFISGKAGIIMGLNVAPIGWSVFDKEMGKNTYLVSPAPLVPNAKAKVPWIVALPIQAVGIAKDTKHFKQAFDALKFMVGPQGQSILLKQAGQFPNRSDVPVLEITGSPGAQAIQELLKGNSANGPLAYLSAGSYDVAAKDFSEAIVSGTTSQMLTSMEAAQAQSIGH
jgi:ABC-type glycerol-3-phosphate transport system substrate-binding protein